MPPGEDDVWRLPATVKGADTRLNGGSGATRSPSLSSSHKARLRRIVSRAPEAVVKVTGRSRGGSGHLKAHLDYITRNGRLAAETQDGQVIRDRAALRALHDDWLLANAAEARGKATPNAAQSVGIILSMTAGTPPDRVEAAARSWAKETFAGTHDWVMARHDDKDHPHVHVTVRAVGYDGRRLAPGPDDLQRWRERFARELRRHGIEAEATPRQARGVVPKAARSPVHHGERRGAEPRVRAAERREAGEDARTPTPRPPHDWSRDIQARQENIRAAYLHHAEDLARGDAADRQLGRDIQRFVADMPVALTRRQAMAVELRRVLETQPGRAPAAPGGPPGGVPNRERVPDRSEVAPAPSRDPQGPSR